MIFNQLKQYNISSGLTGTLVLFLALTFCGKKTTVFYVTPKFSVLRVPLEMTEYFLDEIFGNDDRLEELCKSASLQEIKENGKKKTKLSPNNDLKKMIIKHLMNSLPDIKLSSEEIDTYCKKMGSYSVATNKNKLNSEECKILCYANLGITTNTAFNNLYIKYKNIDISLFDEILFILNEIFNSNIEDEEAKGCLCALQKKLKDGWIRKIVTDYIQNNHNKIDTTGLRIISIEVDCDCYFDKKKINKAFDTIEAEINLLQLDEGYILLEPAFYLHSESSLTYNDDKTKKETINDKLLECKYDLTDTDLRFIKNQKFEKWRIIMRLDYEVETIKKYINYDFINNNRVIYYNNKRSINKHIQSIYKNLNKKTTTKIICNPKKTNSSFDFFDVQTYETLHVSDEQPKTKQETSGTQN